MIKFISTMSGQALLDILLLSHDATAIYTGEELTIQLVNDAMLDIWGKKSSVHGMRFEDAIPEMKGQPFTELLKEVWRTGNTFEATDTPATLEVEGEMKTSYFDFTYRAIRDDKGSMYCILHTATDVTDRVAAWKLARAKQAEADQLNLELVNSNLQLGSLNDDLTALNEEYQATNEELQSANEQLAAINEEYQATNEQMAALNEEYFVTNEQLQQANERLVSLSSALENANSQLHGINLDLNKANSSLSGAVARALSFFHDTPFAVALLKGSTLTIESANPAMLELWGKSASAIGRPLLEAIPELNGQQLPEVLAQVYSSGETYNGWEEKIELIRAGERNEYHFNFIYKPILGPNRLTESIIIVASEVSEQVHSRKLVEEQNQRLSLALNAAQLGSYELDLESGKMLCSDQCKTNFGVPLSRDFDFPDLMQAIMPHHREMVRKSVEKSIASDTLYDIEYQISWPEGSVHWIQVNGRPRYDKDGKALKMIGVTQDITLRKQYELRKDDFLSVASHEMKTPITVLKGNLQLLGKIRDKIDHPLAAQLILSALTSMDRLNNMVDELLDLGRHTDGNINLHKTCFDISLLMAACSQHVQENEGFDIRIQAEPMMIEADQIRIGQVITNFVNNAVKYAPDSKQIRLELEKIDEQIRISVSDQGQGIPKDELPHLFERYYQGGSKKGKGLGLGLYISSEIIRSHQGQIGADSQEGVGSTFWFIIPITD
ncbi:ATP-binding protein [Pedobacter aquatilis]|uniref:ATP-binding protein n=1 Tax=Pedobacter aquatilis TaxID=351343 RepID=UPI002931A480|nr:ATP-binding protein [Pedobacter aquatilis]